MSTAELFIEIRCEELPARFADQHLLDGGRATPQARTPSGGLAGLAEDSPAR